MRGECPSCKKEAAYFSRFDRFGCISCNEWTETDHCGGGECDSGFEHAPEKPSMTSASHEYLSKTVPSDNVIEFDDRVDPRPN